MAVNVGYISSEEVNRRWVAEEASLPQDAVVHVVASEDDLPNIPTDAVVYDLDHISPDERQRVLDRLSQHPPAQPTAIHGHDHNDAHDDEPLPAQNPAVQGTDNSEEVPAVLRIDGARVDEHSAARQTAVHGYILDDEQAEALKLNGVHVHRQVNDELFEQLLRPVQAVEREAA